MCQEAADTSTKEGETHKTKKSSSIKAMILAGNMGLTTVDSLSESERVAIANLPHDRNQKGLIVSYRIGSRRTSACPASDKSREEGLEALLDSDTSENCWNSCNKNFCAGRAKT